MGILKDAHKHCSKNRIELLESSLIGCFYCQQFVDYENIVEWINNQDAVCPKCGIDSIIGDASGFKLTKQFLAKMHQRWFNSSCCSKGLYLSLDRFIVFQKEIPTLEQLKHLIEDYFADIGKVEHREETLLITLPGKPSNPFKRIDEFAGRLYESQKERWIEVCVCSLNSDETFGPNIDILTRSQDRITNDIAEGLANTIARYFKAQID